MEILQHGRRSTDVHTHTYGQSCKASPHMSASQSKCLLWLSLTPGVQGAQCGPHTPPIAARNTCDSHQSHIWDRGRQGWLLLSQCRETAASGRIRPCQGTGPSLHSVWAETALLLSARQFTTQKNEAWKSVMLSSSFSAERSRNQKRESC